MYVCNRRPGIVTGGSQDTGQRHAKRAAFKGTFHVLFIRIQEFICMPVLAAPGTLFAWACSHPIGQDPNGPCNIQLLHALPVHTEAWLILLPIHCCCLLAIGLC